MIILTVQIMITILFLTNVFHTNINMPLHRYGWCTDDICFNSDWNVVSNCCFFKNSSSANAMQNMVIVPTCLLAGCYFPYDIMPSAVQKVANFLPQRWLLDTVSKLQQRNSIL